MHTDEVIESEMERNRVRVVLDFLAEPICKASKAAHMHSHSEVLAFHV